MPVQPDQMLAPAAEGARTLLLRWCELGSDMYAITMLSVEDKWRIVERLGISRQDAETPLTAWRDAMLIENGLAPGVPFTQHGIDLSIDFATERSLHLFVWALA